MTIQIRNADSKTTFIDSGRIVEQYERQPTLDEIREFERKAGDPLHRVDLRQCDFFCTECGSQIDSRYSAKPQSGELLCWDCATQSQQEEFSGARRSTDPAKVVLGESGLYHKSLCDYVINVATGCTHGCKFCYVPSTPNITARQEMLNETADVEDGQREWGSYLLYRDDLPDRLADKLSRKQKWKTTERGRGVVMLSSGTDCYQDRRTAQITRGCVTELIRHRIPVRILTRSPAVCRDIDLYKKAVELSQDGWLAQVGSSIPCLDEDKVRAIEPGAPVPSARLNALQELSDAGIPVYVSMSPTYPTQDYDDLEGLMERFADLDPEVVFHEPINPRGQNFDMTVEAANNAGLEEFAEQLAGLKDKENWVEYSLRQMNQVQELGEKYDIDVHTWPDKQIISALSGDQKEKWQRQREAVSPESIAEVPLPS